MDLRLTFNEVPADYDRWRPTYISELYADIFNYAGIDQESRALEVGIGTGQATTPFLKAGCHVTAIELGGDLAAFSRRKFAEYHNSDVLNMAFEDYECPDGSYDLVYSASAFHWIPEEVGYPKVLRLLKNGGTFARFANHPYKDKGNEPLHLAIQELYAKYMPQLSLKEPVEYGEKDAEERSDISLKYGFIDQTFRLYHRVRTFNAEGYATLIKTYSDHRAAGADRLELFSNRIKEVINRFGGTIRVFDTMDLQLAKKPSSLITPMTIEDYDDLYALWRDTPGIALSAADTRENIEAYLKRNPDQSFVCRRNGKLIGSILSGNDGRRAFLYHLAVNVDYRGLGIGTQLLDRAIEVQAANHIDKCALFVLKENERAISFWEHAGFVPVHEAVTMAKFTT